MLDDHRRRPLGRRAVAAALGFALVAPGCGDAPADAPEPDPASQTPAPVAADDARPNVLVLLADDLRFDGLSATGNPWIETPSLDRIAREGVLFERAYVTTSRCCPSRASFLTGRYVHVHGVDSNRPKEDHLEGFETYPELLQEAGYRTAYLGKWHIPVPGLGSNPRRGFDRWVSYEGPGQHFDQPLNVDGEDVPSEGFQADVLTDYALEFLAEERDDEPFLLVVGFKNPHVPMTPAPRHAGLLDEAAIELPESAYDPLDSLPTFYRGLRWRITSKHGISDADQFVDDCRRYWELVLSIDDNVGRILAALEESGQLDRTVVVATSDNGQLLGEHGIQQKGVSYEPSIRIPLAVRYPGVAAQGGRVSSLALNVDLFPTLMDLCGIDDAPPGEGVSLVPQLRDPSAPGRDAFLYVGPKFDGGTAEHAVVERDWKYVRFIRKNDGQEALFDLVNDPDERTNVVGLPTNAEVLGRMRTFYRAELERLGL